ncbi:conserved hypothetical protein [Paecilomyces variotii No. 5]|uniref:Zn(2)-C6 fungal-type domain-containing protein n=1 Tax=Byssochlamys spectabilis (strain No. 5 / NBRC 109023) TaxID=1356009 RepID=V5FA31_BYSSN|nr:conserved hypothetical protein [Paecilomyces variotii No. 5]
MAASDPKKDGTRKGKQDSSSATAPRKRRKRTVGGGAADDCFTCANRGAKCDRRRPYCSQCLELGRDCSGYKTTLTWGVGVASRGKLRGLSLPVSGGEPVATQKRRSLAAQEEENQSRKRQSAQPSPGSSTFHAGTPITNTSGYHWPASAGHNGAYVGVSDPAGWTPVSSAPGSSKFPSYQVNASPDEGSPMHNYPASVSPDPGLGNNFTQSTLPAAGVKARGYASGAPNTSDESMRHQWIRGAPPVFHVNGNTTQTLGGSTSSALSPDWSPGLSSDTEGIDEVDVESPYRRQSLYPDQRVAFHLSPDASLPSSLPQLLLDQSVGSTPRIRYLMSYYLEVIAPVIVAFDSPTNPYRVHILRLAQGSMALQHAVAALSASNMRQRRDRKISSTERTLPARRSSLAHRALTDGSFSQQYGVMDPDELTKEELYHKGMAIKSLNAQLSDPILRLSDSVLATLLILCLFHICETGVAKFQTQFAGVKKLLTLRSRSLTRESEEGKWYTRMFTWFDTMTATINNREGQLQGSYLDAAASSDEEWALENLAGCDGRLFKIIGSLGRLNLLSQNKPVEYRSSMESPSATVTLPPSMTHYTPPPAISNDILTSLFSPIEQPPLQMTPNRNDVDMAAMHARFWSEWHGVRQALESWRLGAQNTQRISSSPHAQVPTLPAHSYISPPSSPLSQCIVAPDNLSDLSNISESFRYSALLYTERLAFPDLPSDHPRIQSLVLSALHYISAVRSDVYLLWPLFITGSECVFETHRTLIRQRCKDIQKDSGFFNNISCLELLEKIWAQSLNGSSEANRWKTGEAASAVEKRFSGAYISGIIPADEMSPSTTYSVSTPDSSAGFRWRKVIESEGLDGEYIVV